jgi:iron complex outermembrane receptor protein
MLYISARAVPRVGVGVAFASLLSVSTVATASSAIEEVVVTAQRTEQSLQEVPIAVTAFTGAMLEDNRSSARPTCS